MLKSAGVATLILFLSLLAVPAGAQSNGASDATSTTSVATTANGDPSGSASDASLPSTTVEGEATTTTTQSVGRTPQEGFVDPLANVGSGDDPTGAEIVDPNADGEEAIEAESYSSQPQYQPPQVLVDEVEDARSVLEVADADYSAAINIVRDLRLKHKSLEAEVAQLDRDSAFLIEEAERIRQTTEDRAIADFLFNRQDLDAGVPGNGPSVEELVERNKIATIIEFDSREVERYNAARSQIDAEAQLIVTETEKLANLIESASEAVFFSRVARDQALIEFEAFSAGSEVFISGVVFPISGTVSLPLIDSYGFPRAPGTPDSHWHEGIDIFAPRGTPLVATESGVVNRVGVARLGGKKLWLTGDSGVDWYFAHLEEFAPGLQNGQRVEAGDLIGYVGDSGNAVGTPPHTHMELHPNGARPVNPFPLLASVVRTEQQLQINGFSPEPIHQPLRNAISPAAPAVEGSEVS